MRAPIAGLLAWILPGLGHVYVGQHKRGLVLFVAVTGTFWSGVAVGGVVNTVDYQQRKLWFTAQLCAGGNTLAAVAIRDRVAPAPHADGTRVAVGHWLSSDIGVHYTGVAGLLNLLVIFDAVGRAERPPDHRHRRRSKKGEHP